MSDFQWYRVVGFYYCGSNQQGRQKEILYKWNKKSKIYECDTRHMTHRHMTLEPQSG